MVGVAAEGYFTPTSPPCPTTRFEVGNIARKNPARGRVITYDWGNLCQVTASPQQPTRLQQSQGDRAPFHPALVLFSRRRLKSTS